MSSSANSVNVKNRGVLCGAILFEHNEAAAPIVAIGGHLWQVNIDGHCPFADADEPAGI
jgi:hypothetical protein